MSEYIPGPWEVDRENVQPKNDEPEYHSINAPILNRYGVIADTLNRDHCISPDEDHANANIIAAAPEMLDVLRKAYEYLGNIVDFGVLDQHPAYPLWESIGKAIDHAEGGPR